MRKVTLAIAKLGLSIGDSINLQLINSIGGICVSTSGYSLSEDIVLDADIFEKELLENDSISVVSSYQLTLANKITFTFRVPSSFANEPHDLLSLFRIGCYAGVIIKSEDGTTSLSPSFVKKLDLYFAVENPHFTNTQKDLVDLFEYYANEVKYTSSTIDIVQMMDEYLSTIGV